MRAGISSAQRSISDQAADGLINTGAGCGDAVSAGFFSGENLAQQSGDRTAEDYASALTLARLDSYCCDACVGVHFGDVDHRHHRGDGASTTITTLHTSVGVPRHTATPHLQLVLGPNQSDQWTDT